MTLDKYTWDQAHVACLATANGFKALDIPAGTVRWWAAEGLIHAVGKAPGGAHLYDIGEVSAVADRPERRRTKRHPTAGLLATHPQITNT